MILNVANVIKPKKIENYLVILNKIDRQSKPELSIKKIKSIITNNLLDELNLANNIFIPLDSRQLKHQTLMKKNFEHYLFFLFNQYVEKSVIPFKDKEIIFEEEKKYYTKNYSFLEFLNDQLKDFVEKGYVKEIEMLEEHFNENYDYDSLGFEEIMEKIKNQEPFTINFDIDLEDEEATKIFKCLYICFKEKKFFPQSNNVNNIFHYFDGILNNLKKNSTVKFLKYLHKLLHKTLKANLKVLSKNLIDFMKNIKILK